MKKNSITDKNDNIQNLGMFNKYAQILTCINGLGVKTFSYLIPDGLKAEIKTGQPVLVPFGKMGLVNAFVTGFSNYLPENIKAKSITAILDDKPLFDIDYLKFLEWVSSYYYCDIQTVLECAIPMKFLKQSKRLALKNENVRAENETEQKILDNLDTRKTIPVSTLLKRTKFSPSKFYSALHKLKKRSAVQVLNVLDEAAQKHRTEKYIKFIKKENAASRQLEILELLENRGEQLLIDFEKAAKTTRATVKKLVEKGFVEILERDIYRNPLDIFRCKTLEQFPSLSEEQQIAYEKIIKNLKTTETILLHGVTSSGKTEVYFRVIQNVLEQGKNVLFLAPEIAIASMLTNRIARRFGVDSVALWHSGISEGEKYDVWNKIQNNEIRILAGARSAVFAPLKNIGAIIIDEEHESSFKQTTPSPRYNAKDVAKKLAELNGCPLILGSATPDVSSYYRALNSGNLIEMKKRYNDYKLADVYVIDMREEIFRKNHGLFSRQLVSAIQKNLEEKKQTLLLMNRRGFSLYTRCLACGEVIKCSKCDIPMVYHSETETLKCHYCNEETPLPQTCPECGSDALRNCGTGVQKVEAAARKLFSGAVIERLDSDTLTRKNRHIEILNDFSNGKIDILIGTQMIAKGLDNPNVTLVGVINADGSFSLPDFRSCERGFQLLTQVAGRAGRSEHKGSVYFQTLNPEFFALETAQKQDYMSFYKTEIEARELFDYPPFSKIIRIVLSSVNRYRAEKSAQEIAMRLRALITKHNLTEPVAVLGAAQCIIERLQNNYRFQIIVKNKLEERGHRFVTGFLSSIKLPPDIKMTVDVDPLDIL